MVVSRGAPGSSEGPQAIIRRRAINRLSTPWSSKRFSPRTVKAKRRPPWGERRRVNSVFGGRLRFDLRRLSLETATKSVDASLRGGALAAQSALWRLRRNAQVHSAAGETRVGGPTLIVGARRTWSAACTVSANASRRAVRVAAAEGALSPVRSAEHIVTAVVRCAGAGAAALTVRKAAPLNAVLPAAALRAGTTLRRRRAESAYARTARATLVVVSTEIGAGTIDTRLTCAAVIPKLAKRRRVTAEAFDAELATTAVVRVAACAGHWWNACVAKITEEAARASVVISAGARTGALPRRRVTVVAHGAVSVRPASHRPSIRRASVGARRIRKRTCV